MAVDDEGGGNECNDYEVSIPESRVNQVLPSGSHTVYTLSASFGQFSDENPPHSWQLPACFHTQHLLSVPDFWSMIYELQRQESLSI